MYKLLLWSWDHGDKVVVVVVYDNIAMHKKGENWKGSIELSDYTALVHNYMIKRRRRKRGNDYDDDGDDDDDDDDDGVGVEGNDDGDNCDDDVCVKW